MRLSAYPSFSSRYREGRQAPFVRSKEIPRGGLGLPIGGLRPWAGRRCLGLIRERLSEDISLGDLAAEASLSPFQFARMFRQSLGVPPRVYLTLLRAEKACERLEQTHLPLTEIALEVGCSSKQDRAPDFLKHMRLNPSDYRRAVRDPGRPRV